MVAPVAFGVGDGLGAVDGGTLAVAGTVGALVTATPEADGVGAGA
jgi:hypothetical protein